MGCFLQCLEELGTQMGLACSRTGGRDPFPQGSLPYLELSMDAFQTPKVQLSLGLVSLYLLSPLSALGKQEHPIKACWLSTEEPDSGHPPQANDVISGA